MPTAARSEGTSEAPRNASATTARVLIRISFGSCSTQPGRGRIWRSSRSAIATIWPPRSKTMKRVDVVPWSIAPTYRPIHTPSGPPPVLQTQHHAHLVAARVLHHETEFTSQMQHLAVFPQDRANKASKSPVSRHVNDSPHHDSAKPDSMQIAA